MLDFLKRKKNQKINSFREMSSKYYDVLKENEKLEKEVAYWKKIALDFKRFHV